MKLLIDMNLSPHWVDIFAVAGIEAVHWSVVGRADAPDEEIMEYAGQHDFVVFTHDLDFGTLLAVTHASKPSVIQIRSDNVFPDNTANPVVSALRQLTVDIEKGALVTIDTRKARVRLLPLSPRIFPA